ncbi:hypothetical protein KIPB_015137 [Kipferlia bialata]|uniref:THH1/TOM1/TOM3 domain-containing protein n=1 Tax=Kipferlia bialata TaxID=797122 RepID=A0A391NXM3_9EUKA|nr:hypothetical protein KIPB_015137 [Kipferlia bialata]|eukprot:g15137.t1
MYILEWVSLVVFFAQIAGNVLLGGDISAHADLVPLPISPATYAFSVWAVIYLLELTMLIHKIASISGKSSLNSTEQHQRVVFHMLHIARYIL